MTQPDPYIIRVALNTAQDIADVPLKTAGGMQLIDYLIVLSQLPKKPKQLSLTPPPGRLSPTPSTLG